MDLVSIDQIISLLKVEPGLVQSLILLGIWFNTRGVKREVVILKQALVENKEGMDKQDSRLDSIELGINNLNIRAAKLEGVMK